MQGGLVQYGLLGLLDPRPRYGYDLKREFDERFPQLRPVDFGQLYATLSRMRQAGRLRLVGAEVGLGPRRKRYEITPEGRVALDDWLTNVPSSLPDLRSVLFVKVVIALLSGRPAEELLDAHREHHLAEMRRLTQQKTQSGVADTVAIDYALFHLEADLRWIDHTARRLARLREEVTR